MRNPHPAGAGEAELQDMRAIGRILAVLMALAIVAAPGATALADPPSADGQATPHACRPRSTARPRRWSAGVRWRVFSAKAEEDGSHALVVESNLAQPTLTLPPGDYVVHAAFGLASAAKRLTLGPEVRSERLQIAAGGLKIGGVVGDAPIDPSKLSLAIYVPVGRNPQGKLVDTKAKAGDVVGLPEGALSYRFDLSRHGRRPVSCRRARRAPASRRRPLRPRPCRPTRSSAPTSRSTSGKLTDVTLRHRCATLTLKLVNKPGGEALANTTFTVLTPGGDVIRELMGAFPSLVLAEGEYAVIARHDGKTYQSTSRCRRVGPRRGSRCRGPRENAHGTGQTPGGCTGDAGKDGD